MENIKEFQKENAQLIGKLVCTIRDKKTGRIKRKYQYKNLIPTVGRKMIADNLTNSSPDNVMRVTHVALGSNATAPANGDTTLGTETYRNAVASQTNADNVAFHTGFFDATEVTGTFNEAGLFSNGTGSVDTGILFSHVAISITKSNTETLTIDWTISIN